MRSKFHDSGPWGIQNIVPSGPKILRVSFHSCLLKDAIGKLDFRKYQKCNFLLRFYRDHAVNDRFESLFIDSSQKMKFSKRSTVGSVPKLFECFWPQEQVELPMFWMRFSQRIGTHFLRFSTLQPVAVAISVASCSYPALISTNGIKKRINIHVGQMNFLRYLQAQWGMSGSRGICWFKFARFA